MHTHSKASAPTLPPVIEKYLEETYPSDLPGAVVAILRHGEVIHKSAYGLADMHRGIPMSVDCVHRIGSLTKQFTAAAIMLLHERKLLSLDDALTTHLPGYPARGHAIRLSHLLNHTAGVACYTDGDDFETVEASDLSQQQVLDLFQHAPLMSVPGTRFSYSNSGYFLLGLVIESVSGTPLAEFFHRHIFTPLGMRSTALEGYLGTWPIQGYTLEPGLQLAPAISMSIPFSSGALVSTVDDLIRWEAGMGHAGLLPAAAWQRMWEPTVLPSGETCFYGYGFERRSVYGLTVIDHDGGISGFTSYSARTPDRSLFVCVLSNNDSGDPSTIDVGETIIRALSACRAHTQSEFLGHEHAAA
jgi:CubicO group peptidase (beta-lactamase class C family)